MKNLSASINILVTSTVLLVPYAASAQPENNLLAPSERLGINLASFQQTTVPPEVRQVRPQ